MQSTPHTAAPASLDANIWQGRSASVVLLGSGWERVSERRHLDLDLGVLFPMACGPTRPAYRIQTQRHRAAGNAKSSPSWPSSSAPTKVPIGHPPQCPLRQGTRKSLRLNRVGAAISIANDRYLLTNWAAMPYKTFVLDFSVRFCIIGGTMKKPEPRAKLLGGDGPQWALMRRPGR